jgi:hypothetical protein
LNLALNKAISFYRVARNKTAISFYRAGRESPAGGSAGHKNSNLHPKVGRESLTGGSAAWGIKTASVPFLCLDECCAFVIRTYKQRHPCRHAVSPGRAFPSPCNNEVCCIEIIQNTNMMIYGLEMFG